MFVQCTERSGVFRRRVGRVRKVRTPSLKNEQWGVGNAHHHRCFASGISKFESRISKRRVSDFGFRASDFRCGAAVVRVKSGEVRAHSGSWRREPMENPPWCKAVTRCSSGSAAKSLGGNAGPREMTAAKVIRQRRMRKVASAQVRATLAQNSAYRYAVFES